LTKKEKLGLNIIYEVFIMKGYHAILGIFGMVILVAGFLVIGSLPVYFTFLHKQIFTVVAIIVGFLFIAAGFK